MLYRPSLIPSTMKSTERPTGHSHPSQDSGLGSLFADEEIVIVEPTDPDEDRLQEQDNQHQDQEQFLCSRESRSVDTGHSSSLAQNDAVQSTGSDLSASVVDDSVQYLRSVLCDASNSNKCSTNQAASIIENVGSRDITLGRLTMTMSHASGESASGGTCSIATGQRNSSFSPLVYGRSGTEAAMMMGTGPTMNNNIIMENLDTLLPILLSTDPTIASVIANLLLSIYQTGGHHGNTGYNHNFSQPAVSSISRGPTQLPINTCSVSDQSRRKQTGRAKRFTCPLSSCPLTFSNRFNLTEHIRTHTGERPFVCNIGTCTAAFKRRRSLRDHMKIHEANATAYSRTKEREQTMFVSPTDNEPLVDTCSVEGTERCDVWGPATNISVENVIACEVEHNSPDAGSHTDSDGERVSSTSKRPLGTFRSNPLPRYPCPYANCDKVFAKSNRMRDHAKTHTGERPYTCPYPGCSAAFSRPYSVRRHVRGHLLGRRHPIRWCDIASDMSNALGLTEDQLSKQDRSELSLIESVRPTKATLLQPKIPQSDGSTSAMNMPLATTKSIPPIIAPKTQNLPIRPIAPIPKGPGIPRPHPCPFKDCTKTFAKMYQLRDHIWSHTGRRPFACNQCKASFVRLYDLRRHEKIHLRMSVSRGESVAGPSC